MKFVDRKRELQALHKAFHSAEAELVILFGRRRVGKTRLMTWFIEQEQIQEMLRMMELRTTHETQAAPARTAASNQNIDRSPKYTQIRSNKNIPPWDEKAANSSDCREKFQVFVIQMTSYFRDEECEDALSVPDPIKVHKLDVSRLTRQFGHEAVDKARRAMRIILDKVTDPTLIRHIDMLGSPSESWQHLLKTYTSPQQTEIARLEYEWQTLRMVDGEIPLKFLSRAKLIRREREKLGVFLKDADANKHITRCLSAEYDFRAQVPVVTR